MIDYQPEPAVIVGRASVIDGDTLEIRGRRIRLWGVDAPESRQTCQREGLDYRCGQEAANSLAAWLGSRNVSCRAEGRADRYGRMVARCELDGADIGGWLVTRGLALDYPRYSRGAYSSQERQARTARRGLWAGTFITPWAWRAR